MSRGGIFVHSRQPFPIGTQLRLDLQLLNGTPLIVGEGTVFWTREPDPNKPSTVPGMGIRFSKLSGRSQQVIELVLTQRTGKERSGLFPTLSPTVAVEESGRILNPNLNPNPKSKLPFNVFPGSKNSDDRERLATAGREEATPLVGVSAATMADARPHRDETAAARAPAPAAPIDDASSAHSTGVGGGKRPPPALALIKPGAQQTKNADKATVEGSGLHRKLTPTPTGKAATGASRTPTGPNAIPPVTATQEVALPAGSISPATPVEGEPAPGASHSALSRPTQSGAVSALATSPAAISLRPPMTKKLIIGAGALLALGLTIFATTRPSTVSPEVKPNVRTTTTTTTAPATTAATGQPATGATLGTDPTQAASGEGNGTATSAEAEGTAAPAGGKTSAAANRVVADRRGAKTKAAPAHRGPEPQPAAHASSPSLEKPPVAEAPPRVEPPAPAPTPPPPPPAPVAVAHAEPPAAPRSIGSTAPPPVAAIAHKLRMTSIPSEAEVEIDGKVVGKTPLFGVEIDATRPHTLVVHKDGFSPFKQTISGSSEWSVRPSENTATLRISALMKKL